MMNLNESLYREHLEELSTLYDQYVYARQLESFSWYDYSGMEQRMEPHIDALVIGGARALKICIERSFKGDDGECYGALRVMSRQARKSSLKDLLKILRLNLKNRSTAVQDALCRDLPKSIEDDMITGLLKQGPSSIRLAARIIAFRRLDYVQELYDILQQSYRDKPMAMTMLHALGRLRPSYGAERMLGFLHSTDKDVVDAAVTALVRIGERGVLRECMAFIGPGDWPKLSLGLYGGKHALTDSFFSVSGLDDDEQPVITKDYVIASGLLGNIQAVSELIGYLDVPNLSEMAALSLNLITGADLEEEVFVADTIDPDDLFDDEQRLWEKGELFVGGSQPGRLVRRLSRNPYHWTFWWKKHRNRFKISIRYRNGEPYTPLGLIRNLKSRKSPDILRQLAYEELVIRYGIDIPFETNMTVNEQLLAIETMMVRINGNPDGFKKGLWYYNGKPIQEPSESLEEVFSLEDEGV